MKTVSIGGLAGIVVMLAACGGATPPAEQPEAHNGNDAKASPKHQADAAPETSEGDGESAAEALPAVPTECAAGKQECLPPLRWVNKLCENVYPGVALVMFQEGTPWQRVYLRGKTEAVNASGGASVAGFLEFDEEVLVLRHRGADKSGIQIGDSSGSYDALRWNGSCVSLEGGEITTSVPPKRKNSSIEWKWLGEKMQDALRQDPAVDETYKARRKECKGATMGAVSRKCEQLDTKLTQVIADYVRGGAKLPTPEEHP